MIADEYSPNGEEILMNIVIGYPKPQRLGSVDGFIVYSGNVSDTGEPYVTFQDPVTRQVARISLIEPKYLISDFYINIKDIDPFNRIMHERWDYVLYQFNYIMNEVCRKNIPVPTTPCPDYTQLKEPL
jgi:hypothetical protein